MTAPQTRSPCIGSGDRWLDARWAPARATLRAVLARDVALQSIPHAIDALVEAVRFGVVQREDAVRTDDASNDTLVVVSGALKVVSGRVAGRTFVATMLQPGTFLRLAVLRTPDLRLAAVAHIPSLVGIVNGADLRAIATRLSSEHALQFVSAMWREPSSRLYEKAALRSMPLEQRVLQELYALAEEFGTSHERGILIDLPLRQADVADLAGATRANVNRALGRLEQEGRVERLWGRFLVLQPQPRACA